MSALEARPSCRDCGRPIAGACFCDRITQLPTRTRILLLQHPRERHMAIGTARMAHLALPGSRLRVGLDFADDPDVRAALEGSSATYVLFPGPGTLPVEDLPRDLPISLIVLDGTWWQARKLLRLNPAIAGLPRVAFRPRKPSDYLIRREPADFCVSTVEALAEVLRVLEPEGARFERLLDPFHAMVERQRWFQTEVRASRHHRPPRLRGDSPRRSLAARLARDWSRLVCVHGEANAWPRHHPAREAPETIHWVAHRPATVETFEAVVAPRRVLATATPQHVELAAERLRAGSTVQDWHDAWREFTRPDDVLVLWGTFYRGLAAADGLSLAFPTLDLRVEASRVLRRRVGTVEKSMAELEATPVPLGLPGRGGRRLAAIVGALESLRIPPESRERASSASQALLSGATRGAGSPDEAGA